MTAAVGGGWRVTDHGSQYKKALRAPLLCSLRSQVPKGLHGPDGDTEGSLQPKRVCGTGDPKEGPAARCARDALGEAAHSKPGKYAVAGSEFAKPSLHIAERDHRVARRHEAVAGRHHVHRTCTMRARPQRVSCSGDKGGQPLGSVHFKRTVASVCVQLQGSLPSVTNWPTLDRSNNKLVAGRCSEWPDAPEEMSEGTAGKVGGLGKKSAGWVKQRLAGRSVGWVAVTGFNIRPNARPA